MRIYYKYLSGIKYKFECCCHDKRYSYISLARCFFSFMNLAYAKRMKRLEKFILFLRAWRPEIGGGSRDGAMFDMGSDSSKSRDVYIFFQPSFKSGDAPAQASDFSCRVHTLGRLHSIGIVYDGWIEQSENKRVFQTFEL